jgi:hypothetical protein
VTPAATTTLAYLSAPLGYLPGGRRPSGQAAPLPARSTLAGILGAALGVERAETDRLAALARGLRWGVAVLDPGEVVDGGRGDLVHADLGRVRGPVLLASGEAATGRPDRPNPKTPTSLRLRPLRAGVRLVLALDGDWRGPLLAPRWPLALGSRASLVELRAQRLDRPLDAVLARLARLGLQVWAPGAAAGVTVWSRDGGADVYARVPRS